MLSPRHMTEYARNKFREWATWGVRAPEAAPIFLSQRRVFILPTRHGLWYGGALFALLGASVQYNLNLGFILTFAISRICT
jgi:hypothetical protein